MQTKKELTPKEKFEKLLEKWKKQVNDKENDIQKRNNRKRKIGGVERWVLYSISLIHR